MDYITGLPDAYGRGRIIGDYRRAALYGIDFLIEEKKKDHEMIASRHVMSEENIRTAEEITNQITALKEIKKMAERYGYDISGPAKDVKRSNPVDLFRLPCRNQGRKRRSNVHRKNFHLHRHLCRERPCSRNIYTEEQIQEFVDDFILKLRVARHLRTTEYNELFGGDPMWITEGIGRRRQRRQT